MYSIPRVRCYAATLGCGVAALQADALYRHFFSRDNTSSSAMSCSASAEVLGELLCVEAADVLRSERKVLARV